MRRRRAPQQGRFQRRDAGEWIETSGRIIRLLPDDRDGDQHQRFIVDVGDGRTLLVAHNIDIAPKVPVSLGDRVTLRGVYEWNELGGLLHWTHRDPLGEESGGYVQHRRKDYR